MKKIFTLAVALWGLTSAAKAEDGVIMLDLTKAETKLEFDAENGMWTATMDEDEESIESQCFSFVHSAMSSFKTWWGFTASNSADNSYKTDIITYQYSNMALGGIALNEDGTIKKNDQGAVVSDSKIPYLVAYYSPFMARKPVVMAFNDNKAYEAVGVYVNLNSYAYYCLEYGLAPARPFTDGDSFKLLIHGVSPDETENVVEVGLASYSNGDLTINRGWKYVDLSSLGVINELYFTMTTTDKGAYGDNTPEYFCLDKLMVKAVDDAGVNGVENETVSINYDRNAEVVYFGSTQFAMVCDVAGCTLMSGEVSNFDMKALPAGVYIVKAGNRSIKIAK